MVNSKNIYLMDGFIDINPRDNQGVLKYKIKHPVEISNGNWGCKIIILKNEETFYHNSDSFACNISLFDDKLEFVYFSKDSKMLLFYEVKNREKYLLKVIDYSEEKIYELNMLDAEINFNYFISEFKKNYYSENITLIKEFENSTFIKDKVKKNIFNRWF